MNPAKALLHLFSPLGGDEADNYRSPGQISFLRAPFVSLDVETLKDADASYAFVGVPFDEGMYIKALKLKGVPWVAAL